MHGTRGASAPLGILAQHEPNGILHGWPLVMLDKLASVQEDPLFADLQKAVALLPISFDNPGGQIRSGWRRHGANCNSPFNVWSSNEGYRIRGLPST